MSNALYEERNRGLLDQVALKETDRIPFVFGTRFWAAKFAGITFEEQMYDAEKSTTALERVLLWLEPDGYTPSLYEFDGYCKTLITRVGKGGGFILDGAASIPDEAKPENVMAMAKSVHRYAN